MTMKFSMTGDTSIASEYLKLKLIETLAQALMHMVTAKFLELISMKVSLLL
jgi:hypothetical protein